MAVRPELSLNVPTFELPNPLAQMAQVTQIQGAMQQQKIAGMQIEQLEQDRREMLELQQKLAQMGQNPDLRVVAQTLMRSPKTLQVGTQMLEKLKEQDAYAAYLKRGEPTAAAAPGAAAAPAMPSAAPAAAGVVPAGARVNALAPQGAEAPEPANALLNRGLRTPDVIRREMLEIAPFQNVPTAKAHMEVLKTELAEAVKAPTLHNVPGRGAVDPRTGRVVVSEVTKPDEFERLLATLPPEEQTRLRKERAQKMATHPPVAGELTAAQLQKLKADAAKANTEATATIDTVADLKKAINDLRTSPGLAAATGYTGVYLPSFTEGEAAQAEVRLNALKGKITAFGKAAAAQSGAIGSIANQEWKILSDQVAAIDPVKGKKPLLEQLANLEQQLDRTVTRVEAAYKDLYGSDENVPVNLRSVRGSTSSDRPTGVGADWVLMTDGKGNRAWVSPDKKQIREVP